MLAPQSDEEIRPIRERMRGIDPLLDLRWNPEAYMVAPGSYSELGTVVRPTYEARWEVIRYDSERTGHAGFHEGRGFTVICALTEWTRDNGVIRMVALRAGGAYVPVGEWVIEMLHQADAQNVDMMRELRRRVWAEDARAVTAEEALDEGAALAGLDHNHFTANYAGGVGNWQGRGADFRAMEANAAQAAARATSHAVSRILTPSSSSSSR